MIAHADVACCAACSAAFILSAAVELTAIVNEEDEEGSVNEEDEDISADEEDEEGSVDEQGEQGRVDGEGNVDEEYANEVAEQEDPLHELATRPALRSLIDRKDVAGLADHLSHSEHHHSEEHSVHPGNWSNQYCCNKQNG